MAQTAEDCALLLDVMAGFDERDSTSINRTPEDYRRNLTQSIAGLKIGLPKEYFSDGLANDVAKGIDNAIQELKKLGKTKWRPSHRTMLFLKETSRA